MAGDTTTGAAPERWMEGMDNAPAAPTYDCQARETCPPLDTESTIRVLARSVARSQKQCLSHALNFILVQAIRARNISLQNMQVMQQASATSRCSQQVDIDLGSLQFDVRQTLDEHIEGGGDQTNKTKMINDITEAFGAQDVNLCVGTAVNQYRIRIQDVTEDVVIRDIDINQLAETEIQNCIQKGTIRVNGAPLRDYLDEQVKKMPNARLLRLPDMCPDPSTLNKYFIIVFVIALVVILFAVLVAILF